MVLHVLRLTQPFNVHRTSEIIIPKKKEKKKDLKMSHKASADLGLGNDHTLYSEGLVAFYSFPRFDSLWLWNRQFLLYETSLQGISFKFLARNISLWCMIRLSAESPEIQLLIIDRPNINSVNCLLRKSFSATQRELFVDHRISQWTVNLMTLDTWNDFWVLL